MSIFIKNEEVRFANLTGNIVTSCVLSHPEATISKNKDSDIGWDIRIVDVKKTKGDVTFFGTGIHLQPPAGYYFKIEPRSSISKTDYMLANGIGNIDETYTGEILVPLRAMKGSDTKKLELPQKIVQLVLYKRLNGVFLLTDKLKETERGDQGFGSSGK